MSGLIHAMRPYRAGHVICATCGREVHMSEAWVMVGSEIRHAINCVAPPTREAYRARVAAKRAARLAKP